MALPVLIARISLRALLRSGPSGRLTARRNRAAASSATAQVGRVRSALSCGFAAAAAAPRSTFTSEDGIGSRSRRLSLSELRINSKRRSGFRRAISPSNLLKLSMAHREEHEQLTLPPIYVPDSVNSSSRFLARQLRMAVDPLQVRLRGLARVSVLGRSFLILKVCNSKSVRASARMPRVGWMLPPARLCE
jgi:hypothetical protein